MTSLGDAISSDTQVFAEGSGATVSGVVLLCTKTGRVLMLQRGIDAPDDPAAGTWEWPGGHLENGESPLDGGKREWEEEVGQKFPTDNDPIWTWMSNGIYQGFIIPIDDEKDLDLTSGRTVSNADDDYSEQSAWWRIQDARMNPALREECKSAPWDDIERLATDHESSAVTASDNEFARGRAWGAAVDWDPLEHPRDYRGRFIETGANVSIAGGLRGRVTAITPNRRNNSTLITVQTTDGRIGRVDSAQVTVLEADKNDLPSTPRGPADPRSDGKIGWKAPPPDGPQPTARPNPAPETVAPRAMPVDGAPRGADGRPLQTGDRVSANGRTGTITSVRAGIAVFREDGPEGRLRSARHERISHISTAPENPDTPTPDVTPDDLPGTQPPTPGDESRAEILDVLEENGYNQAESRQDGPDGATRTTQDGVNVEVQPNGDVRVDYREAGDYDVSPDGRGRQHQNAYSGGKQRRLEALLNELGYETRGPTFEERARDRRSSFYILAKFIRGPRNDRDRDGNDDGDGNGGANDAPNVPKNPETVPDPPFDGGVDLPGETPGPGEADGTSRTPGPSVAVGDLVVARNGRSGVVTSVRPSGVVVFVEPDGRRRSSRADLLRVGSPDGTPDNTGNRTGNEDRSGVDVGSDAPKAHDGVDAERTNWQGVQPDDPNDTLMSEAERRALIPDDARAEMVETALSNAMRNGKDSKTEFFDRNTGAWNADRASQHDAIIDDLYGQASNVPNDRKAVMTGGLTGSGKTTVLRQHNDIDPDQYLEVSTDRIREELARRDMIPNIPGLTPMERSILVQEEASHLARLLAERAQLDGKNMIWNSSMSTQESVQGRLNNLRENGYNVNGVFVSVSTDHAVSQARNGWVRGTDNYREGGTAEERGFGGRYIPESVIRNSATEAQSRSRNEDTFNIMRTQMDDWELWDNMGAAPVLISSRSQSAENRNDAEPRVDVTDPNSRTPGSDAEATPEVDPDPTENGPDLVDTTPSPRDPVTMNTWEWAYAVQRDTTRTAGSDEAARVRVTEVRRMSDEDLLQRFDRSEVLFANSPIPRPYGGGLQRWQEQAITRIEANSALMRAEIERRNLALPERPDGRAPDAPRQQGSIIRDREMRRNQERLDRMRDYSVRTSTEAQEFQTDLDQNPDPTARDLANASGLHDAAARAYEDYSAQLRRIDATSGAALQATDLANHHREMRRSFDARYNEKMHPASEDLTFKPPVVDREKYVAWGERADEIVNSVAPSIAELRAAYRGDNRTDKERMRQMIERHYNGAGVDGNLQDSPGIDRDGKYIMTVQPLENYGRRSNNVTFSGTIVERETGITVGRLTRTILMDGEGRPQEVHNDLMSLNSEVQGNGIANNVYRRGENWFIRDGVPKVTIHADIDVGGFAWARKGFDWDRTNMSPKRYLEQLLNRTRSRGSDTDAWRETTAKLQEWSQMDPESPGFPTPFMVSELGRTDGSRSWPGKRLMLGTDWMAVKQLVPPNPDGIGNTETRRETDWQLNAPPPTRLPDDLQNATDRNGVTQALGTDLERLSNSASDGMDSRMIATLRKTVEREGIESISSRLTPDLAQAMYGEQTGQAVYDSIQAAQRRMNEIAESSNRDPNLEALRRRLQGYSVEDGVPNVNTQEDADKALLTDKPFDFELGGKNYRLHQDGTVTNEAGEDVDPKEASRLVKESMENDETPI